MKSFDDVLKDIEALCFKELSSIKSGANIIVQSVNRETQYVTVQSTVGAKKTRTRSFIELRKIRDALATYDPAHVDTVLAGAGSSRNQPETIFANLPYIEWLLIDRRKHIVAVREETHDLGTLRKMDGLQAQQLTDEFKANLVRIQPGGCVVTGKLSELLKTFEDMGFGIQATGQGEYLAVRDGVQTLLIDQNLAPDSTPTSYLLIDNLAEKMSLFYESKSGVSLYTTKYPGVLVCD